MIPLCLLHPISNMLGNLSTLTYVWNLTFSSHPHSNHLVEASSTHCISLGPPGEHRLELHIYREI